MKSFGLMSWWLALAVPVVALCQPATEELEQNRRQLEKWRAHPERFARLQRDARQFLTMPPWRREQILRLDHDLAEESSATQARLFNVLDRYVSWLAKLDEKERQRILEAPDKQSRLKLIKELRQQQWLQRQPLAIRQSVEKLQGGPRQELVHKLRLEEKHRKLEWVIAARFWNELQKKQPLPCRLADFPADVQMFVNEYLKPMLAKDERERLDKAQGQWPLYPLTLVEIADKHPVALPGPEGPRHFTDLPSDLQRRFKNKLFGAKSLKIVDGRWPHYAEALTALASKKEMIFPNELWPYNPQGLSRQVKDFLEKELTPVLDGDEKLRLASAIGQWPAFPKTLDDLARAHNLRVPWQTLPGPPERWQNYRLGPGLTVQNYPALSMQKLRTFAMLELDENERAALNLSHGDPQIWQRLTEVYFQRKQDELKQLRQHDLRKSKKKK